MTGASLLAFKNSLYLVGGYLRKAHRRGGSSATTQAVDWVSVFTPKEFNGIERWEGAKPLLKARSGIAAYGASAVFFDEKIFLIGGFKSDKVSADWQ